MTPERDARVEASLRVAPELDRLASKSARDARAPLLTNAARLNARCPRADTGAFEHGRREPARLRFASDGQANHAGADDDQLTVLHDAILKVAGRRASPATWVGGGRHSVFRRERVLAQKAPAGVPAIGVQSRRLRTAQVQVTDPWRTG